MVWGECCKLAETEDGFGIFNHDFQVTLIITILICRKSAWGKLQSFEKGYYSANMSS